MYRRVDIELGLKEARLLGGSLLALEVSRGLPGDVLPSCASWLAADAEELEVLTPALTALHAETLEWYNCSRSGTDWNKRSLIQITAWWCPDTGH